MADTPIIRYGDPVIVRSEDKGGEFYVYVLGPSHNSLVGPCDLATANRIANDVKADLKALDN